MEHPNGSHKGAFKSQVSQLDTHGKHAICLRPYLVTQLRHSVPAELGCTQVLQGVKQDVH